MNTKRCLSLSQAASQQVEIVCCGRNQLRFTGNANNLIQLTHFVNLASDWDWCCHLLADGLQLLKASSSINSLKDAEVAHFVVAATADLWPE